MKDIFVIENEKQRKLYTHPETMKGCLVEGLPKSIEKVTDNRPRNVDK
jgi:hypothetical protein